MHRLSGNSPWRGHSVDIRDVRGPLSAGIVAIVDPTVKDVPAPVTGELVYSRFPLIDERRGIRHGCFGRPSRRSPA